MGARASPDSIADGLSAPFAGEHCIAIAQDKVDDVVLVAEDEIREGMRYLYQRASSPVRPREPCRRPRCWPARSTPGGSTVVSVVSGGNVAPRTASGILDPDEA